MDKFLNLDKKRVCDISEDRRTAEIVRGRCLTRITVNRDGTLKVENTVIVPAKEN